MALHRKRIEDANTSVAAARARVAAGRYRQHYHFMAPAFWINDPNGCIYFRGAYHIFYQHNPYAAKWGIMHWGHAVSEDLVHWRHLPVALAPSEDYDDWEYGGCFSGSAIEHDDKLYVCYTGSREGDGASLQTQCLAVSEDGLHFQKYADNPVITDPPPGVASCDFRDPKLLRWGENFYMLLGAAMQTGKQETDGCALLYRSKNLQDWDYLGPVLRSEGRRGTMWECPDLFQLGDRWVLMYSAIHCEEGLTWYQVGDMDFETGSFRASREGQIDHGFEYYAPQSFAGTDERAVIMGWQYTWEEPAFAQGKGPTCDEDWAGFFALPRSVHVDGQDRLSFRPVETLRQLRQDGQLFEGLAIDAHRELFCGDGMHFELLMDVDLRRTSAARFCLRLRVEGESELVLSVDLGKKTLCLERRQSGGAPRDVKEVKLRYEGDSLDLQLISDTCSLECFVDEGRSVVSANVYRVDAAQKSILEVKEGSLYCTRLECYPLRATVMQ